ncbi:hypothetical protein [Aquimarina agarilytica]|uniref:hypothetical protein n=1 Tax=Aquimarina agarilytica TaxID=1087449 RepID=UPI0002898997|nr:hypothetical protein [Aquimarina agarilytica]
MIIPIPAAQRRFQIRLKIKATMPFELGLQVYDPRYRHSYYFKRKAFFKGPSTREFIIALPVSPEVLELAAFDKNSQEDYAFQVEDLAIEELPVKPIWANASEHRFMEFAINFAQKAGYTNTGFYDSPNQEFLFHYLPRITDDFGKELITPARTHRKMPRVQISQRLFLGYTIPVRVAILAHEGCHWFLNTRSQTEADLCGMKKYLDYGFPVIEAVYAVTKVFGKNPELVGPRHISRTQDVLEFIKKYKFNA